MNSARSKRIWLLFVSALRVCVITFLATLVSFAIALFFSIVGMVLVNSIRGGTIDMSFAYRRFAFPIAMAMLIVAFVATLTVEIKNYRRTRPEGPSGGALRRSC